VYGEGVRLPTGKGSGRKLCPLPKTACFAAFWAVRFFCVLSRKNVAFHFSPEVVIWWTLKMHFWEIVLE